jgi:hypothetical protein
VKEPVATDRHAKEAAVAAAVAAFAVVAEAEGAEVRVGGAAERRPEQPGI